MPEPITSESPLVRFDLATRATPSPASAGVVACERAFLGHLNLRGDARDARFVGTVREVGGVDLPIIPNTVSEARGHIGYWLGPDEWLIVTVDEHKTILERELRAALVGLRNAVTDVTGGQTVVVVRGDRARDVLTKGCPIDLHPRAFDIGRCAQSHLAKAPILLRQVDRQPSFEIIVRRSYADYLWSWLEDAAAEYGFGVTA